MDAFLNVDQSGRAAPALWGTRGSGTWSECSEGRVRRTEERNRTGGVVLEVWNRAVQPIEFLLVANTATGGVAAGEDGLTGVEELGDSAARADSELECHCTAQQQKARGTRSCPQSTTCFVHQQTPVKSADGTGTHPRPVTLRTIKENIVARLRPAELDRSAQGAVLTIENETEIYGSKCGVTRATCKAGVIALEQGASARNEQEVQQVAFCFLRHLDAP